MFGLKTFGSNASGNSHLLTIENTRILLDAGVSPGRMDLSNVEIAMIDAVLITHEHSDHSRYVKNFMERAINCYMTQGTREALGLITPRDSRARTIKYRQPFLVGDLAVTAFPSFHDAAEPAIFLISGQNENVVYITDTKQVPYKFSNLTQIIIEANYSEDLAVKNVTTDKVEEIVMKRVIQTHLSIDDVIDFLKRTDIKHVKTIYLTHLSDFNSNAEEFKEAVKDLTGKEVVCL